MPLIVSYSGYLSAIFGLASGANYLFDLDFSYKRFVFPADWKFALIFIINGICLAAWGYALDSVAFQGFVMRHKWVPWADIRDGGRLTG